MSSPDRQSVLSDFADELFEAESTRRRIERLSNRLRDLNEAEAYSIAAANCAREASEPAGFKLGYTSAAMRLQMNIAEPNFGVLTRDRIIGPGNRVISLAGLVHPRVEPEITVQLRRDLHGGGCTIQGVRAALECAYPSLEIVDTRYHDYVFKAVDNIADNSSAARCILGKPMPLSAVEPLTRCAVELWVNAQSLATGSGADAMGDPLAAVAWLADKLATSGRHLKAGDLVMTGGLTRAFPIRSRDVLAVHFDRFKRLVITCEESEQG
jgi:2-keto-4-pentenoate hydratase